MESLPAGNLNAPSGSASGTGGTRSPLSARRARERPSAACLERPELRVRERVRGAVVRVERGLPVVYVLVEAASHYYQVMTKSAWMPALVGQRI